ncbi:MAG: KH domain-containing protein [Thermoprotei archaeon]
MYPSRIVISIPEARLKSILDKDSWFISEVEKTTGTKITVKKETGEITIDVSKNSKQSDIIRAREMIQAYGHGFDPNDALRLRNSDVFMEIINLKDYLSSSNDIIRVKGRIIGAGGKTKSTIIELTGASISISDNEIVIIGDFEQLQVAKRAIEMLINGSPHTVVYRFLERFKSAQKIKSLKSLGGDT